MKNFLHLKITKLMRMNIQELANTTLRLFLSVVFILYGWKKLENIGAFEETLLQINVPILLAYPIALTQFFGGILVLLDFLTKYILPLFFIIMLGAIWFVGLKNGFFVSNAGYEYQLALLLIISQQFTTRLGKK